MQKLTDLTKEELIELIVREREASGGWMPIDPRDYGLVRKFARAVIEADRDVRKGKCDCKGPCSVCGLIDGCSAGCGDE